MNLIESEIRDSILTKEKLIQTSIPSIEKAAQLLVDVLRKDGFVLFCGNGGSACDASHIAAELVVRFKSGNDRKAIPALALSADQAVLTAGANDYGYDSIFERQVEAFGRAGDLLIALTTSGNSPNILKAIEMAKKKNLKVLTLLGGTGGKAKGLGDAEIIVPSSTTARIQECHITIGHILCSLVERDLFGFQ